jgi:hypothetical protein
VHGRTVRRFTDAAGLEWHAYDIENRAPASGIHGAFLCFERGVDRRRLTPIPADWKECGAAQLDAYRAMAKPVHRSFVSPDQLGEKRR